MRNPRILLAGVVALAVPVGAAVVLIAGGGSEEGGGGGEPVPPIRGTVRLERGPAPQGGQELIVSLADPRLNSAPAPEGATSVLLRCVDRTGRMTINGRHAWPLAEEPGYPPHVHQPAEPRVLDRLRSCRLTGTGIALAGRVVGRLPRSQPVQ